jgi:hypothetical protein
MVVLTRQEYQDRDGSGSDSVLECELVNIQWNNSIIELYCSIDGEKPSDQLVKPAASTASENPSTPKKSIPSVKRASPFRSSPLSIPKKHAVSSPSKLIVSAPHDSNVRELQDKIRKLKLAISYKEELVSKKIETSIGKWIDVVQEAFQQLLSLVKDNHPEISEKSVLKSMGISGDLIGISSDEEGPEDS